MSLYVTPWQSVDVSLGVLNEGSLQMKFCTRHEEIQSPPTEPQVDRSPWCTRARPGSARGLFRLLMTPMPCRLWHETFHLDLGRPACVRVTAHGVLRHTSYRFLVIVRYRRVVGFIGGSYMPYGL
jgi:hypothetical protein